MHYLRDAQEIRAIINQLVNHKILWLDTEIADWKTPKPRLSLIQVLANPDDTQGDSAYLLDVLDKPNLIQEFINKIMKAPQIEKVFHNASFDLRYLGGKEAVNNIKCTYQMAQKITKKTLNVPNLQLKTLAQYLCKFSIVQNEQASDWGKRSLTQEQLEYAAMDVVYLAHVHHHLLNLSELKMSNPANPKLKQLPLLTPEHLYIAEECPRLFHLTYSPESPPKFTPDVNAKKLNDFSLQFIEYFKQNPDLVTLFDPSSEDLEIEKISEKIKASLYENIFFPYLQKTPPEQASKALEHWQILTHIIKYWTEILASNRQDYPADKLLEKTFIFSHPLTYQFTLTNQEKQEITSQIIPLLYQQNSNRLIVFSSEKQFPQIALISYILKQQEIINFNQVTCLTFPDLIETNYNDSEIDVIVKQLLSKIPQLHQWLNWNPPQPNPPSNPQLCGICPQFSQCQKIFPEKNPKIILPPPSPIPAPPDIGDTLSKQLVSTLNAFGIKVDYVGVIVAPAFVRIKLKPHPGVRVSAIINRNQDLQVQLGIESTPMIQPQAGFVSVDLPRKDRQIAHFEQYLPHSIRETDYNLKMSIGVNLNGELVEADLTDSNTCHFLIGGTTGSGKSEFLRSILLSLLVRQTPEKLKVVLVDPKRVTFPELERIPWLYEPIIKEEEDAIALMNRLVDEMENRYIILERAGYPDIKTYNQKANNPQKYIPHIVCIFDEYADFMTEKETRTQLEQSIKRLGAKARAAGIHLIIATQRPDAKVVTPLIRSNLPGRIALKTASAADSKIILGDNQPEAVQLLGKGDLLYPKGTTLERLQALFISDFKLYQ